MRSAVFGSVSEARTASVLNALSGCSILPLEESEALTEQGGMIALWGEENRARLDLNLATLTGAHLKISSKAAGLGGLARSQK